MSQESARCSDGNLRSLQEHLGRSDEPEGRRRSKGLDAGMGAKLDEGRLDVTADGVDGEAELVCDRSSGQASCDQAKNFVLTRSQFHVVDGGGRGIVVAI